MALLDLSDILIELGLTSSPTEVEKAVCGIAIRRTIGEIERFLRYNPVLGTRTEFYPQADYSQTSREAVWEVSDTQAYLRYLSEASTNQLLVRSIPIRSITALYIDYDARNGTRSGAFAAESLKVEGVDYWANYDMVDSAGNKICQDGILRSVGRWPSVAGSVKIVYTTGYTAAELAGTDPVINASPIHDAAVIEAARQAKKAFINAKQTGAGWAAGPFSSESLGDYSYSIDTTTATKLFGAGSMSLMYETKERLQEFVNIGWSLAP